MKGFIFRTGVRIKDFGERMGHVRIFGFHVFNWFCGLVIRLGLTVRDSVRNCPIGDLT